MATYRPLVRIEGAVHVLPPGDTIPFEVVEGLGTAAALAASDVVQVTGDQTVGGAKIFTSQMQIRAGTIGPTANALVLGADNGASTVTDDTTKNGVISSHHYNSVDEIPILSMWSRSNAAQNDLMIGGGSSLYYSATRIQFYIGADRITTTGTLTLSLSATGVVVNNGTLSVGGNLVYHANGTDVAVADGGTGASDASGARTNLGVAYGSTAGTVAQGNDARLTDAREWTAATVSQPEAEAGTATDRRAWTSQRVRQAIVAWWATAVTTIGTTVGRAVLNLTNPSAIRWIRINADNSVTARSDSETRTDLGLGTAALGTVTTTNISTTAGQIIKVGDYGLGTGGTFVNGEDWNTYTVPGMYSLTASSATNAPGGLASGAWNLLVLRGTPDRVKQLAYYAAASGTPTDWERYYNGTTWSAWRRIYGYGATQADARTDLGLGTAAVGTVTTTQLSTTANQILKVGDYGLGLMLPQLTTDLNNHTTPGMVFLAGSGVTNYPSGLGSSASIFEVKSGSTSTTAGPHSTNARIIQRATKYGVSGDAKIVAVRGFDGTSWTAWYYDYGLAPTAADARTNLGLGTAATATLTTSTSDNTTGRVLKVADFNLFNAPGSLTTVDMNTMTAPGRFMISSSGLTNSPNVGGGELEVTNVTVSSNTVVFQRYTIFSAGSYGRQFHRVRTNSTDWSTWIELTSNLGATTVSATPDYNLFTVSGIYLMSGTGATNGPAAAAFMLHVTSGTASALNDRVVQVATRLSTPFDTFIRTYNGSTWSAWIYNLASQDLSASGNRWGVVPYIDTSGNTFVGQFLRLMAADASVDTADFTIGVSGPTNGALDFSRDDDTLLWQMTNAGQLLGNNGSVGSPIYSFINDPNTGIYNAANNSNDLRVATDGTLRLLISTTVVNAFLPFVVNNSDAANAGASITNSNASFASDGVLINNTGGTGGNLLRLRSAGVDRLTVSSASVASTLPITVSGNTVLTTADKTSSIRSTTLGQVMKVGDYGLGVQPAVQTGPDWNTITTPGLHYIDATGDSNGPLTGTGVKWNLWVTGETGTASIVQLALSTDVYNYMFYRTRFSGGSWSSWLRVVMYASSDLTADRVMVSGAGSTMNSSTITTTQLGFLANVTSQVSFRVAVPATPTSTGIAGTWAADSTHIYHCYATNTWRRAAHATW